MSIRVTLKRGNKRKTVTLPETGTHLPVGRDGINFPAAGVGWKITFYQRGKKITSAKTWDTKNEATSVVKMMKRERVSSPVTKIKIVKAARNPKRRNPRKKHRGIIYQARYDNKGTEDLIEGRGLKAKKAMRRFLKKDGVGHVKIKRIQIKDSYFKRNPGKVKLPSGTAPDGTRYTVKKDANVGEWQVVAYVKNKRHEGRTYYALDKEDAISTWKHLMKTSVNPKRRNPSKVPAGWKSATGTRMGRDIRNGQLPHDVLAVAKIVARQGGDHVSFEAVQRAEKELSNCKNLTEAETLVRRLARALGYKHKLPR